MRILVIDDEPQIRKLLKVSLGAHGYHVDEAAAGQEGINRVALFKPDLIILDLGLPDIDGKDVPIISSISHQSFFKCIIPLSIRAVSNRLLTIRSIRFAPSFMLSSNSCLASSE
ncbi:MAG TPA: response regulator [Ruminiclostridium sp.]|nr:response regulator [Ruminiclostridium sp.]